jgi:hypothetical protein
MSSGMTDIYIYMYACIHTESYRPMYTD